MNEAGLRSLLREAPVPAREEAERRGLEVLEAAFAERRSHPEQRSRRRTSSPRRLAIALALAALLAAVLLSPAGASVRDWVDDVFTATVPRPEPGLAEIPGGGRLLVQSRSGPWVVQPDGSRRLLGDFEEATWSPRGLYVAAVSGRTLSALEPDGTPRWSLGAEAPIADPRWSPSGFEISYRSGRELRVTDADGSGDRLVDPSVAPVAAAWSPLGLAQLAYVDADGSLRIADAASDGTIASAPALAGVERLEWASSGLLLEVGRSALRVRSTSIGKLAQTVELGPARRLSLPPGASVRDTALSPSGKTIAAVFGVPSRLGPRGLLVLFAGGGGQRRLFNAPGRLSEVAWAPRDDRLLIAWPSADQWLFLPTGGREEGRSITGVANAFAPGQSDAAFPSIEGWCCRSWIGNRG